jgi:hypothetical protein
MNEQRRPAKSAAATNTYLSAEDTTGDGRRLYVGERFEHERLIRDRAAALARKNRYLRAERDRLERLLALALKIAAGDDCEPTALLEVIGATLDEPLERPAWVQEQQRRPQLARAAHTEPKEAAA